MVPKVVVSGYSLTFGTAGDGMISLLVTVVLAGRAFTGRGVDGSAQPVPDRDGELG